jgi:amino acid transporter
MSTKTQLRPHCLNFIELLAQNIALISPTMTAALIVPLMFSNTGNLGWLSFAVGTIMLLFVAFNLNQFAKRTTNSGSMYSYAYAGLGFTGGSMCGWCLLWAYLFIGLAGTTGFTIFASKLLEMVHMSLPPVVLFAACLGVSFLLAFKDIKISTLISLGLEAFSVTFILLLCVIVLGKHHFAPDPAQFTLKGLTLSSLGLGIVVAVFSGVGFESSTAFGEEAVNPLKTIPKSIIWSLIVTGLFFIVVCYTETLGVRGYKDTLDKLDAPLNVLSDMYNVSFMAPLLSAGAMFSFYALASSCMNAGARVMYAMGRHGIVSQSASAAHEKHGTPHVALAAMTTIMFAVVLFCKFVVKWEVLDIFNNAGTFGAFGFLGAYFLVSLAAPFYLKKRNELKAKDIGFCAAALLLMIIPAVGSVYPVPPAPANYFPYIFLAYLACGFIRSGIMSGHPVSAVKVREISEQVDKLHVDSQPTPVAS